MMTMSGRARRAWRRQEHALNSRHRNDLTVPNGGGFRPRLTFCLPPIGEDQTHGNAYRGCSIFKRNSA